MLRTLFPIWLKKTLKKILYTSQDIVEYLTGKRDKRYPPRRLNFVGSHDFKKIGNEFVQHFKKVCYLNQDESVLDIGSGIGRIAIPLTQYLSPDAHYEGFDIDYRGIKWCQKHITPQQLNFQFQFSNIYNKFYNKHGKIRAQNFRFPYDNTSFDFVFAASVFTHMLAPDIEQYLTETYRVLKPNGRVFLTFFVLNNETDNLTKKGLSNCNFRFQDTDYPDAFFSHKSTREAEIGYNERWIRNAYKKAGFISDIIIHRGNWSGRKKTLSYQDIILCSK